MLKHYLKISIRELLKYKVQSTVSIAGLAIGFTVCLLAGYSWWWETHFDNFHPEGDRLYCLTTTGIVRKATGADADLNQIHANDLEELKKRLPEIEATCSLSLVFYHTDSNDPLEKRYGLRCDSSFFHFFQADFIAGSYHGVPPIGRYIILTESMAQRVYGRIDCVGQLFPVDKNESFVVAGVIRDYPDNSDLLFQFLLLDRVTPLPHVNRLTTYVRLLPGTDVRKVKQKLALYTSQVEDPHGDLQTDKWKINLRTPAEVHLLCHPELADRIRNIRILALAGGMAFISALMNLLVLFIGQQQRKREKNKAYLAIGASFGSRLLKGWTELGLPLLIAYLIAFCLIEILYPFYENYTAWNPYGIYEGVSQHISQRVLTQASLSLAAVSTLAFFVVCYLPVSQIIGRPHLHPVVLKRGLITIQIFIGSFFFICSLILFLQLHFILTTDRGIDYDNVLQLDMGQTNAYRQDLRVLKPLLRNHPYVEGVCYTAVNSPVFTAQGDWYGTFLAKLSFDPTQLNTSREDHILVVDTDFFSFFGLILKDGSWIDESHTQGLLVNETSHRQLRYTDLFSRSLNTTESHPLHGFKVCGVVKDYLYAPLQYPVLNLFFKSHTDADLTNYMPAQYFYMRFAPGHEKEVTAHIQKVAEEVTSEEGPTYLPVVKLSNLIEQFNRPEKIIFSVFSLIALLCILISTFGIYSLVSLSTEQRKREIAIRKVNGATFRHILQLFFREYICLHALANAFALPLGYIWMQRWLETYTHHIGLTFVPFMAVFCITGLVILFSVLCKVKQAAEANPAKAMKSE